VKLFLKGDRCLMAKCPIDTGRGAPGMHMQRRGKMSDYGLQLREKQKLRRFYGLQEKQFRLFFNRAVRKRGVTGEQLLQELELRLDNVVYRLGLSASRRSARQFVRHGHIAVNDVKSNIPSMVLKPGDVVTVREGKKRREAAKLSLDATESSRPLPEWLKLERENFRAEILRCPTREEIGPVANEQVVVELYSK
jgi:small subunit ribosomal protein S4